MLRIRAWVLSLAAVTAGGARADIIIRGQVTSDTNVPISGALVSLRTGETPPKNAITETNGSFRISLPAPGTYRATVAREGFFRLDGREIKISGEPVTVQFVLAPVREVFESIDVTGEPAVVNPDGIAAEQQLDNSDMIEAPYPSTSNLRNALRLLPGMVHDSRGGIHLHGAAEEQVLYTLDGFNIADPLTGRLESRFTVEAVQSVDVTSAVAPAEFGKGSGGVLAINSKTGDDKFRYEATNFFPSFEWRKGLIIGGWSPRFGFSGPIRKGRAWYSNNLFLHYLKDVINDLPKDRDRTSSWRVSNLSHVQVNLTPANIFSAGVLINTYAAPRSNLSVLDPPETTVDRRQRQWFFDFKDQFFFPRGSVLQLGYAHNRTFNREIPQGRGLYEITPYGKGGFYFVDATRHSGRDQVVVNYILPSLGRHQIKAGVDLNWLDYSQNVLRTGFEHFRVDLTRARQILFQGSGVVSRRNTEAAEYLMDSWRVRPNLLLTLGLRSSWDRLVGAHSLAPRVSFTWSPAKWERLRVSGGYAIARDAANLRLFARLLDQYPVATNFNPDGSPVGDSASSFYVSGRDRFSPPRYRNWNLGFDHQFGRSLYGKVSYLRKRGSRGLAFQNLLTPGDLPKKVDAIYDLGNYKRDSYDAVEFTVRHVIGKQYEWMASYIRSRSRTTAALDLSLDDTLLVYNNTGPTSWAAPNRLISWGYLPAPWRSKNWAVAYMTEWHTGLPFSVQDDHGKLVGGANGERFPDFLELNLHIEWRFLFRGYRWALRGGCNNFTGHRNYNVVNNNASSPLYRFFYGGQGRTFNFRIRWLGKQ